MNNFCINNNKTTNELAALGINTDTDSALSHTFSVCPDARINKAVSSSPSSPGTEVFSDASWLYTCVERLFVCFIA